MKNYHYYTENQEQLPSNPSSYEFYFNNHHFTFHTDDGVFSKGYIDYGSYALLKAYVPNKIEGPVLDMGAGYGPIGITISTIFEQEVYMCEINQRAFGLIEKNIEVNGAKNCKAFQGNLYESLPENVLFSSILTNPPIRAGKAVVNSIYDGAFSHLVNGGELWVVIQKKQGAPSSKEYIANLFGNCAIVDRNKGYYILKATKMSEA